jgi:hypothetical protein
MVRGMEAAGVAKVEPLALVRVMEYGPGDVPDGGGVLEPPPPPPQPEVEARAVAATIARTRVGQRLRRGRRRVANKASTRVPKAAPARDAGRG